MKRTLPIAAGLLLAVPLLWACGPYLPNWILGSDEILFETFKGTFTDELTRLQPSWSRPPFAAVPAQDDAAGEALQADKLDLEQYLEDQQVFTLDRVRIVNSLVEFRAGLAKARAAREELLRSGENRDRPLPSGLKVPEGLSPELADYLEGAIAYHENRPKDAVRIWEKLLRRPRDQRQRRSTWAAFMIGRTFLESDPDRARQWFQRTRELAMEAYDDRLGLAASSLGWEALLELRRERWASALELYDQQARAEDPRAVASLRFTCAAILKKGPGALADVAGDPEARGIFTAWIVSRETEDGAAWLQALEAADVRDAAGADRFAWAAYLAGDFARAAAWLERAKEQKPPSPIAKWVRARLLLRNGKLDEARALLAEAAHELGNLHLDMEEANEVVFQTGEVRAAPQRAAGEEAVIRVVQKDYARALDEFLRAGYWMDAAYLAEQVLTAGELKAYVDATWPADLAEKYQPPQGEDAWEPLLVGGYVQPEPARLARELRYLLGRRLAREGRRREAAAYLPAPLRPLVERLDGHVEAGRDAKRPAADRGRQLFRAACITREAGMSLTGTEVEPDWTLMDGAYDVGAMTFGSRDDRQENRVARATPDETARWERNRARPWKRFHYRYRAADLAWEAAALLPAGNEKAGMLATAGNWIEARDPQAAQRFFKELVGCCGSTDLGRKAAERRWLPEANTCPTTKSPDEPKKDKEERSPGTAP